LLLYYSFGKIDNGDKMILYEDILKEENKQDNEILRLKAKAVELPLKEEDLNTLSLIKEYLDNSYDEEAIKKYELRPGVGLAAPQIGVSKKIFGIKVYDENKVLHEYYVINPKIISESVETTYLPTGEGCLSVARDVQGLIFRPKKITVRTHLYNFETKETSKVVLKLKDYLAVVFQHEYDHLQGILFIDRINNEDPFGIPENSSPIKMG
jgi:peptide deformylase